MTESIHEYWRSHFEERSCLFSASHLKQVGKTVGGKPVSNGQIDLLINHISKVLSLSKEDHLLDLGCGNGFLSFKLSQFVSWLYGVDFSPGQIKTARSRFQSPNINYNVADIHSFPLTSFPSASCVLIYEVIQHSSVNNFIELLSNLHNLHSCNRVFIGGVPDKECLNLFYDTESKFSFYLKSLEKKAPHIGEWFDYQELCSAFSELGWSCKRVAQPVKLYTSHYRFDMLLTKPDYFHYS